MTPTDSSGIGDLLGVDRLIHEPARMAIMAVLCRLDSADFGFLLNATGLTKGNLSAHTARLEKAGYVGIEKGFRGKLPHTEYSLTQEGRAALRRYREQLRRLLAALGG